jgi:hypothetical protein
MNRKFVPAYLRSLVQTYKTAIKAGMDNDAQYIQNIFNNVLYEYVQSCNVDEYEEMRPLAKEIDSDFYSA